MTRAVPAQSPLWKTKGGDFSTERGFPANMRKAVDAAGKAYGCHGCGTTKPGTKSGHFIPDHQPPVSQVKAAKRAGAKVKPGSVRLYPHCAKCSKKQRQQQSALSRDEKANAAAGKKAMAKNLKGPQSTLTQTQIDHKRIGAGRVDCRRHGFRAPRNVREAQARR